MEKRFDENLNRPLLAKCSLFDGRYKDLKFLKNAEKNTMLKSVKEELEELEKAGKFPKETAFRILKCNQT